MRPTRHADARWTASPMLGEPAAFSVTTAHGDAGLDAVGDPERVRVPLGHCRRSRRCSTASRSSSSRSRACTTWSMKVPPVVPKPHAGSRRLQPQLAVGDRHRHPARGDHRRPGRWVQPVSSLVRIYGHTSGTGALLAAHDRRDAGARLHHPLLRHRRHAGPGVRADRLASIRSSARCWAGWAWR